MSTRRHFLCTLAVPGLMVGAADIKAWFAEMDRFADVPFVPDGRKQPPMPKPKDLFK